MKKLLLCILLPLFLISCGDEEEFTYYSFIGSWSAANDTCMYLVEFSEQRMATIAYASGSRNHQEEVSWYVDGAHLFIQEPDTSRKGFGWKWVHYLPQVKVLGLENEKYRAMMYLEGSKGRWHGMLFHGLLTDPYRK